jgi:hypothetical protein
VDERVRVYVGARLVATHTRVQAPASPNVAAQILISGGWLTSSRKRQRLKAQPLNQYQNRLLLHLHLMEIAQQEKGTNMPLKSSRARLRSRSLHGTTSTWKLVSWLF